MHHHSLNAEVQLVEEKHLLLAKNLSGALSRYATDLEAVFTDKSDITEIPYSQSSQTLLQAFDVEMVALIQNGQPTYLMGNDSRLPEGGLGQLSTTTTQAVEKIHNVIFSPVMLDATGKPLIYLTRINRSGQLIIAAVNSNYFQMVQKSISFGENGHAAIVDQTGHVIAHPLEDWQRTVKDMNALPPVKMMRARKTGVEKFYTPAFDATMIAGYSYIPETGWGVMIPQPYRELKANARQANVAALLISAIGLMLAIVVSWQLTTYILGPVQWVIYASQAVAMGKPVNALPNQRRIIPQEIHDLLRTFKRMVAEVYLVRSNLEQAVEERTQELRREMSEREKLEQQLFQIATHDALTGLPNRRLLTERLQALIDTPKDDLEQLALLFLDLDGFKGVNDTYGHQVGDQLLVQISRCLQVKLPGENMVFRLGGDEFVILLTTLLSRRQVVNLAQVIVANLQSPIIIGEHTITVGGSVGIKFFHADGQVTVDEILSDADHAMYQAKETRNCVAVYNDDAADRSSLCFPLPVAHGYTRNSID